MENSQSGTNSIAKTNNATAATTSGLFATSPRFRESRIRFGVGFSVFPSLSPISLLTCLS